MFLPVPTRACLPRAVWLVRSPADNVPKWVQMVAGEPLGQTFRKHGKVLHITPSTEGVLALKRKVGMLIKKHVGAPMPALIKKLNEILRGWADYHRHVVSSEAFSRIDKYVFERLKSMVRKRHRNKSGKWRYQKYWTAAGRKHTFAVIAKVKKGLNKVYQVVRLCSIGIKRHIKIKVA